jgi:hypothetical protein
VASAFLPLALTPDSIPIIGHIDVLVPLGAWARREPRGFDSYGT